MSHLWTRKGRIWRWLRPRVMPWRIMVEERLREVEFSNKCSHERRREMQLEQTRDRRAIDKLVADLHTYADRVETLRQAVNHVKRQRLVTLERKEREQEARLRDLEARFSNAFPLEEAPDVINVDEMGIDAAEQLAARAELSRMAERMEANKRIAENIARDGAKPHDLDACKDRVNTERPPTREDYEGESE